ncbi:MAG: hypothetical protein M4579_006506 [Chaenotheca gracillima]|nr:MAG: hypothetical protein M4579_006506 [Chaenotheca gracillima]
MDSKRKATVPPSASPDTESRAAKRLRTPDAVPAGEDAEATAKAGLKFIRDLDQARSKQGNPITAHFQTLPDKAEHPDYYEVTHLPISLETISTKLQNREYTTLTPVESDMKRMISNAKAYNKRDSTVFEDAERVRKFVSSWFKENNPAYRDPKYVAMPTAIPGEDQKIPTPVLRAPPPTNTGEDEITPTKEATRARSRRATKSSATPAVPSSTEKITKAPEKEKAVQGKKSDFAGQSFQQAQEMIVQEMIDLEDETGDNITGSFLNLPPRKLYDYYRLITKPMALNPLKKKVVGQIGRGEPTHQSQYVNWEEFEEEAVLIWNNAKEYNEDESEIFSLALQLEKFFTSRLAEAKRVVPAPAGEAPRLKLKPPTQPTKIKLKVGGGGRDSSAGTPGASARNESGTPKPQVTPGVSIDGDALKRQQQMVQAGVNERNAAPNSNRASSQSDHAHRSTSRSTPATTSGPDPKLKDPDAPMLPAPEVKGEPALNRSPSAVGAVPAGRTSDSGRGGSQPNGSTASMPPPSSSSQGVPNGVSRPVHVVPPPNRHHRTATASNGVSIDLDSVERRSGQDVSNALMKSVRVATHSSPNLRPEYDVTIFTTKDKREIHVWDTLDHTHNYVRIMPVISEGVLERDVKLFVLVNGQRLEMSHHQPNGPNQPIYEGYFSSGIVNRVEVDMCAGPVKGAAPHEFDFERVYFYAYLRKD